MIAAYDEMKGLWDELDADYPTATLTPPPGAGLYPGPDWFDEDSRSLIANIALELEERLKSEHFWHVLGLADRKRWAPRRYHLIAQGIAVGIKVGIAIAERRQRAGTAVERRSQPGTDVAR
jgi:hypothetical protein